MKLFRFSPTARGGRRGLTAAQVYYAGAGNFLAPALCNDVVVFKPYSPLAAVIEGWLYRQYHPLFKKG